MADPEREGNFLTRALGVETFRDVRREGLARGWNQVEAALYAGGVTATYYLFPLSQPLGWKEGSRPRNIGRRFVLDACSIAVAYVLPPIADIGFKIAYNLGVEVGRDALRAARRIHLPPPNSGLDY